MEYPLRPSIPLLCPPLYGAALDGDDCELTGDEETVGQDEEDDRGQPEERTNALNPLSPRLARIIGREMKGPGRAIRVTSRGASPGLAVASACRASLPDCRVGRSPTSSGQRSRQAGDHLRFLWTPSGRRATRLVPSRWAVASDQLVAALLSVRLSCRNCPKRSNARSRTHPEVAPHRGFPGNNPVHRGMGAGPRHPLGRLENSKEE